MTFWLNDTCNLSYRETKGNSKQLTNVEFQNNGNRDLSAYSLKTAKKNTAEKHLGISDVDKSTLNNGGTNIIVNDLIDYVNTFTDKVERCSKFTLW